MVAPIVAVVATIIPAIPSVIATVVADIVAIVPVMAARGHDDRAVVPVMGRAHDHHFAVVRAVRRDHNHPGGGRAIGAGDDDRLTIVGAGRRRVVDDARVAMGVVGEGGEQQAGGDADRGAFGGAVVVVLADDRTGDAADHGVADGFVTGVEGGGNCGDQAGRAGKGEEKAGVHTPA